MVTALEIAYQEGQKCRSLGKPYCGLSGDALVEYLFSQSNKLHAQQAQLNQLMTQKNEALAADMASLGSITWQTLHWRESSSTSSTATKAQRKEEAREFKEMAIARYAPGAAAAAAARAAENNQQIPPGAEYTWCMITHRLLPSPAVAGAHIAKKSWKNGHRLQSLHPLVGKMKIDGPRNCLLLFKAIEVAFDNEELCFLPNEDGSKVVLHLVNESLKDVCLLDSKHCNDISNYLEEIRDYDCGTPRLADMTFAELEGWELKAMPETCAICPYKRALQLHALCCKITQKVAAEEKREAYPMCHPPFGTAPFNDAIARLFKYRSKFELGEEDEVSHPYEPPDREASAPPTTGTAHDTAGAPAGVQPGADGSKSEFESGTKSGTESGSESGSGSGLAST
eukprot:TRINITY_DN818_c1_g1_i1.p1 TRINITY_DN818_c1_g1~~TRINITY_DN818_c1_g1_i1.p1  ORF type:complete len:397 (+),score=50.87 TRINITY_DN818_c1_g1_i1:625-1815(+)